MVLRCSGIVLLAGATAGAQPAPSSDQQHGPVSATVAAMPGARAPAADRSQPPLQPSLTPIASDAAREGRLHARRAPSSGAVVFDAPRGRRPLAGALLGTAAGAFVGALAGGSAYQGRCGGAGDPDGCSGIPGLLVGGVAGAALGAPLGAHLVNGRRGTLGRSLAVHAALAVASGTVMHLATTRGHGASSALAIGGTLLTVPLVAVVSASTREARTSETRTSEARARPR